MVKNLKLLIAEDCVEFNHESNKILDEFGFYSTFSPKDGLSVIDLIQKQHPDVVIMDLFMPKIDAIGVIRSIKQNSQIQSCPIFIILSSFDSPVLEKEAMISGASYFMLKPFVLKDLCQRIVELVESKGKNNHNLLNSISNAY